MQRGTFLLIAAFVGLSPLLLVQSACDKKGSEGKGSEPKKAAPLKMVPTSLPGLKLTMQAPEGAEVTGTDVVTIRAGEAYGIQIMKDVVGVSGEHLIIPFEQKLVKKKLVDQPDLQIWTKDMGGKEVVLFALLITLGEQKLHVQSEGTGMFDHGQVDVMVKSARTLAAQ